MLILLVFGYVGLCLWSGASVVKGASLVVVGALGWWAFSRNQQAEIGVAVFQSSLGASLLYALGLWGAG